jgi:TatD DNase family protein
MLVDSHCHLDFPEYATSLDEVLMRAAANDIGYMQTICTQISKFKQVLTVAERYPHIGCSVGNHPNHVAEEAKVTAQDIIALTKHPKVIGIGETGLDYHYEYTPHREQQDSFIAHIQAAQETGLPVIVHTRDADEDTIDILQEQMDIKKFPGLIHCFSTGRKLAERAIEMGLYVSVSGIVTFKSAADLQNTVKDLPLTSLLVETDAPFLAPVPYRGKTNEPGYTRLTAEFIATLKGIPYAEVARITTENFFRVFSKAKC